MVSDLCTMASVAIVVRKSVKNRNGLCPVMVRLTHNGKSKFLSTKISVDLEKHWDSKKNQVKGSYPNSTRANYNISVIEQRVQAIAMKLDSKDLEWSKVDIKAEMYQKQGMTFIELGRSIANSFELKESYRTFKRYNTILNKLEKYVKYKQLEFVDITVNFLKNYEDYLVGMGNGTNTIHTNLKTIRAIYYEAIRRGLIDQSKNPFFNFKLKKEKPQIEKPTLEEIELIKLEEIDSKNGWLHNTRNLFLFSMYCAGVRVGDLLQLTTDNILPNNMLAYTMDKTNEPRLIKLTKPALDILKLYSPKKGEPIFPLITKTELKGNHTSLLKRIESINTQLNLNLKKIVKSAGIEKNYTMHMARHGFTEIARKKKIDVYAISKALGHSSLGITEQYLKAFDLDDQEETFRTMWE